MSDDAQSMPPQPLEGLRVVEFTHMVMGPTCGMVLADMGAEVIKIEPIDGEVAEIALRVADIGDGKLKIPRPAMLQHLADEFENAGLGPDDRPREIGHGSREGWWRIRSS